MAWIKHKEKILQWLGKYRYLLLVVLLGLGLMLIPTGSEKAAAVNPTEILLVVNSMIGQESVNVSISSSLILL